MPGLVCWGALATVGVALIVGSCFVERLTKRVVEAQLSAQFDIDSPNHTRYAQWLDQTPCADDTRMQASPH